MKLRRTINFNFGWIVLVALVDVAFLLVFFLLLSSNFILQQGISISMPFSRFTLGPQISHQIISISGGGGSAPFFSNQKRKKGTHQPLLVLDQRQDHNPNITIQPCSSY